MSDLTTTLGASIALTDGKLGLTKLLEAKIRLEKIARAAAPGHATPMEEACASAARDFAEMERRARRLVELWDAEFRRVLEEGTASPRYEPKPKPALRVVRESEVPLLSARFPMGGES